MGIGIEGLGKFCRQTEFSKFQSRIRMFCSRLLGHKQQERIAMLAILSYNSIENTLVILLLSLLLVLQLLELQLQELLQQLPCESGVYE